MKRAWYLLLLAPFIGTLFPSLYNRVDPTLFGIPFFYWYQLSWVIVTPFILGFLLLAVPDRHDV